MAPNLMINRVFFVFPPSPNFKGYKIIYKLINALRQQKARPIVNDNLLLILVNFVRASNWNELGSVLGIFDELLGEVSDVFNLVDTFLSALTDEQHALVLGAMIVEFDPQLTDAIKKLHTTADTVAVPTRQGPQVVTMKGMLHVLVSRLQILVVRTDMKARKGSKGYRMSPFLHRTPAISRDRRIEMTMKESITNVFEVAVSVPEMIRLIAMQKPRHDCHLIVDFSGARIAAMELFRAFIAYKRGGQHNIEEYNYEIRRVIPIYEKSMDPRNDEYVGNLYTSEILELAKLKVDATEIRMCDEYTIEEDEDADLAEEVAAGGKNVVGLSDQRIRRHRKRDRRQKNAK